MQSVFKIEGVLTGDARVVALEGRDAADRRVRLELPTAEAGAIAVGSVLVVQWWSVELPGEASSLGATSRMGATPVTEGEAAGAIASEGDATTTDATVSARADAEFRRLMGLR